MYQVEQQEEEEEEEEEEVFLVHGLSQLLEEVERVTQQCDNC